MPFLRLQQQVRPVARQQVPGAGEHGRLVSLDVDLDEPDVLQVQAVQGDGGHAHLDAVAERVVRCDGGEAVEAGVLGDPEHDLSRSVGGGGGDDLDPSLEHPFQMLRQGRIGFKRDHRAGESNQLLAIGPGVPADVDGDAVRRRQVREQRHFALDGSGHPLTRAPGEAPEGRMGFQQ